MKYSQLWLPAVLSMSLFACNCGKDECVVPTITGTPKVAVCQSGDGRLVLDGTDFASNAKVRLVSGDAEFVSTSVEVNAEGTHLTADMPSGVSPGVAYDVIVDNGSCNDAAPHMQVTAVSGAFAFLTDPDVVFDGINTRVTVFATSLDLPLPTDAVQITPADQTDPVTTLAWTPVAGKPNRVQVVIPSGQAVGAYDLALTDGIGCETTIADAVTVTSSLTVAIASVDPPFADAAAFTSVTIKRDTAALTPTNAPFLATPRLFLNPSNPGPTDVAIALQSVSFVDGDTLTAVIPPNQVPGTYDLVIVNPDGSVGLLADALRIQSTPPPIIASITPSSIVNTTGQNVTLSGTSFDATASVTTACRDSIGTALAAPAVTAVPACAAGTCTVTATIDGSLVPAGSVCVVRITNGDGSFFDYSAIGVTLPSLNLSTPRVGTTMVTARRALVAAAGNATPSSRFVYAIGGDGGATLEGAPFSSVESASVDAYGALGTWSTLATSPLGTPRAFAAGVTLGRYIYVSGGTDGAAPLASAERAMILDPIEVPHLDVADMIPADAGLVAGTYVYRVAAIFDAADLDNPGGESLPSDEFVVRVPTLDAKQLHVVLGIDAPRDRLGALIPGVVGYRVYRSPTEAGVSGDSVLIGTVATGQTTFVDDGTAVIGTERPLAAGSLGHFRTLPTMGSARMGHAAAASRDPVAADTWYVYAMLGSDAAASATASYEYLTVTLAPNGHQTVGTAWTSGSTSSADARWQVGAWTVDPTVSSLAGSDTWIYVGGGLHGNGSTTNVVEAMLVTEGGSFASFDGSPKDFTNARAGYGVCAANGQLFAFGGAGASPGAGAAAAVIADPIPGLTASSWNNEGLSMTNLRYLMGSTVQSAFIFLIGGETDTLEATASTELVIW